MKEAPVYEDMCIKEFLESQGIKINEIISSGGGASSDLVLKLRADMLGIPFLNIKKYQTNRKINKEYKALFDIYKKIYPANKDFGYQLSKLFD